MKQHDIFLYSAYIGSHRVTTKTMEKKKAFYEKYQMSGDTLSILLQKYLHFEVQSLMNE